MSGFEMKSEAGERTGEFCLMRGEQERAREVFGAGLREVAAQAFEHGVRGGDVEVGEGLVEQQQVGCGEQDTGERGALTHALGVLAQTAGILGVEIDLGERFGDPTGAGLRGECGFVEAEQVVEVFGGGEVVVEHGAVAHVGDAAAQLPGRLAEDADLTVGRIGEAGEQLQERGFARAVGTEEHHTRAGGELERNVAQGDEAAEELRDAVQGDRRLRSGCAGGHRGVKVWGDGHAARCWVVLGNSMRV